MGEAKINGHSVSKMRGDRDEQTESKHEILRSNYKVKQSQFLCYASCVLLI